MSTNSLFFCGGIGKYLYLKIPPYLELWDTDTGIQPHPESSQLPFFVVVVVLCSIMKRCLFKCIENFFISKI